MIIRLCIMVVMIIVSNLSLGLSEKDSLPQDIKIKHYKDSNIFLDTNFLKNKITLIKFWATWCESCKSEFKELDKLLPSMWQNPNFQFVSVNFDKNPKKAQDWITKYLTNSKKILDTMFIDPNFEYADKLGINNFPMSIVVGKDLKILQIKTGYDPKTLSVKTFLDHLTQSYLK